MKIIISVVISTIIISLLFTILLLSLWRSNKIVDIITKYKSKELNRKLDENFRNKKEQQKKEFNNQKQEFQKELQEQERKVNQLEKQWMNEAIEETNKLRNRLNQDIEEETQKYKEQRTAEAKQIVNDNVDKLKKTYENQVNTIQKDLEEKRNSLSEEKESIENQLKDLRSKEQAAINARIREYEEQNKEDFYKIQISSEDISEIEELKKVLPKIKNELPLRKAIYDMYYREPVKDLTNRLTNGRKISGIYKITHMPSGKCYVGKTVDIANRIKQHTKAGLGASNTTKKKLYTEMLQEGIENFKYEMIEEVDRTKLKERENYWMKYFGAKIYGYSTN